MPLNGEPLHPCGVWSVWKWPQPGVTSTFWNLGSLGNFGELVLLPGGGGGDDGGGGGGGGGGDRVGGGGWPEPDLVLDADAEGSVGVWPEPGLPLDEGVGGGGGGLSEAGLRPAAGGDGGGGIGPDPGLTADVGGGGGGVRPELGDLLDAGAGGAPAAYALGAALPPALMCGRRGWAIAVGGRGWRARLAGSSAAAVRCGKWTCAMRRPGSAPPLGCTEEGGGAALWECTGVHADASRQGTVKDEVMRCDDLRVCDDRRAIGRAVYIRRAHVLTEAPNRWPAVRRARRSGRPLPRGEPRLGSRKSAAVSSIRWDI
jgi:hypothetical protein